MKSSFETLLCVGGPRDGKRIAILCNTRTIRLPEIKKELLIPHPQESINPIIEIEYVYYRRQTWKGDKLSKDILVPLEQSADETLTYLLHNYRPESP